MIDLCWLIFLVRWYIQTQRGVCPPGIIENLIYASLDSGCFVGSEKQDGAFAF